jgi:hypothetical protein
MTSEYLDLPLRSLRDLAAETEAAIDRLETEREVMETRMMHASLELRFDDEGELGEILDRIADELGPLNGRREMLEDEIAWRNRRHESE